MSQCEEKRTHHFFLTRTLIWLIALSIGLLPLSLVEILPLVDYPVHLTRQFILMHLNEMPALQAGYALDWGIKPNLAIDLIVPTIAKWMPLTLAARLFTGVVLLQLVGATCYLTKVLHGKVGLLPLLSLMFLYNINFFQGYLNCLMSSALMIMTFAVWIQSNAWQRLQRIGIIAALTLLIFFLHLFPLAVFALTVLAFEAGRKQPLKVCFSHVFTLIYALIPVTILWFLKPSGPEASNFEFGPLIGRAYMWLGPVLSFTPSDVLMILIMLLVLLMSILEAKGNPFIHSMRWPLFVLFLSTFLIPQSMLGGSGVHLRLPVILTFIALASLSPHILTPQRTKVFLILLLLILSLRSADIARKWIKFDLDFSELRTASMMITPGARVMTLDEISQPFQQLIFSHATDLAILERCIFVPHMAKIKDQQPIVAAPSTQHIDGGSAVPVTRLQFDQGSNKEKSSELLGQHYSGWTKPYFANWPDHFDYVFHIHDKGYQNNPKPEFLDSITTGSFFSIYRVRQRPTLAALKCL